MTLSAVVTVLCELYFEVVVLLRLSLDELLQVPVTM